LELSSSITKLMYLSDPHLYYLATDKLKLYSLHVLCTSVCVLKLFDLYKGTSESSRRLSLSDLSGAESQQKSRE
jgi:hypothetical protein